MTSALVRRPPGPLPPVRIAIAYRDPEVGSALRAVFEQMPGCQIVADGTDATEVAEEVRQQPSDLLLVDVRAPQIDGMTDLLDAARQKSSPAGDLSGGHDLTPREREVLGLIAAGLSNRQIAERLVISPRTVKNHVSNIYRHIDVSHRSQAMNAWRDLYQPGELTLSQGLSA
jgi:DNA-binding NarL/FixJ family response regulator